MSQKASERLITRQAIFRDGISGKLPNCPKNVIVVLSKALSLI